MKQYDLSLPHSGSKTSTMQIVISITNINKDMLKNDCFLTKHLSADSKNRNEILGILKEVTIPDVLTTLSSSVRAGKPLETPVEPPKVNTKEAPLIGDRPKATENAGTLFGKKKLTVIDVSKL